MSSRTKTQEQTEKYKNLPINKEEDITEVMDDSWSGLAKRGYKTLSKELKEDPKQQIYLYIFGGGMILGLLLLTMVSFIHGLGVIIANMWMYKTIGISDKIKPMTKHTTFALPILTTISLVLIFPFYLFF